MSASFSVNDDLEKVFGGLEYVYLTYVWVQN